MEPFEHLGVKGQGPLPSLAHFSGKDRLSNGKDRLSNGKDRLSKGKDRLSNGGRCPGFGLFCEACELPYGAADST